MLVERRALGRVQLFVLATNIPMGQQAYERHLFDGLIDSRQRRVPVQVFTVRSLRSRTAADRRTAMLLGDRAGAAFLRKLSGVALARSRGVLNHRLDLRLPPMPNEVVTVHDLAPWIHPDEGKVPVDAASTLRRARAVVAPSMFAAGELRRVFGIDNVHAIHNGVPNDLQAHGPLSERRLADLEVRRPFVLHVGGATQRKNLDELAAAWSKVAAVLPDAMLVSCGPEGPRRRVMDGLPRVVRLPYVDRPTLVGLLRAAACVVVPSLYEGFGLPVLEAMALRRPVVVANTSALAEVSGDGGVLVEPKGEAIALALLDVLRGDINLDALVERGARRAARFTWEASVSGHLDLYEALLDPSCGVMTDG